MRKILKYKLELGMNTLQIPGRLCGVHVAPQPGVMGICQLWTAVDESAPEESVGIYVAATGEEFPDNMSYLGTVLLSGGAMVFHALLVKESVNG